MPLRILWWVRRNPTSHTREDHETELKQAAVWCVELRCSHGRLQQVYKAIPFSAAAVSFPSPHPFLYTANSHVVRADSILISSQFNIFIETHHQYRKCNVKWLQHYTELSMIEIYTVVTLFLYGLPQINLTTPLNNLIKIICCQFSGLSESVATVIDL
jgi:hypothetical protein